MKLNQFNFPIELTEPIQEFINIVSSNTDWLCRECIDEQKRLKANSPYWEDTGICTSCLKFNDISSPNINEFLLKYGLDDNYVGDGVYDNSKPSNFANIIRGMIGLVKITKQDLVILNKSKTIIVFNESHETKEKLRFKES
jgi:hypothetical protein